MDEGGRLGQIRPDPLQQEDPGRHQGLARYREEQAFSRCLQLVYAVGVKGGSPSRRPFEKYRGGGRHVLSFVTVRVVQYYGKQKKGKIEVCSKCGEAYPASQGDWCLACQGKGYYKLK